MQKLLLLFCFAAAHFAIGQNTTSFDYKQPNFEALDKLCNAQTAEAGGVSELLGIVHNRFATNALYNNYINVDWGWNFDEQLQKIKTAGIGALLFADPKQVKAIYKAAISEFKTQFARMTAAERAAYLKTIDEAIVYSQQFDLAKENADLAKIEQSGGSFVREKGKLNAFIYRRLAKNELTKADCVKWLKQARKDLASVKVAPNVSKEAEYILRQFEYTENLFEGHIFGSEDEKAILHLASGNYKVLLEDVEQVDIISYDTEIKYYSFKTAEGLMGVFDENGKIILAPEYANIDEDYAIYNLTTADGLHGRAKIDGTILIPPKYIELEYFNINKEVGGVLCRAQDSLVGLMSRDGKEILPAKYRQIISIYRVKLPYLFIFEDANKKYGAMNEEFKTIIPAAYTHLEANFLLDYITPYFTFSIDGKKEVGLLDANGKVLISPNLSHIRALSNPFCHENRYFNEPNLFIGGKIIDGEQKYALFSTQTFNPLTDFVFTHWLADDTIFVYAPETFKESITPIKSPMFYRYAEPFFDKPAEFLILRQGSKQTVYDNFGKMLVPPVWDSIRFVGDNANFYHVSKNNKWGVIDAKNKLIIAADCDVIYKHAEADLFFVGKVQADNSLKYAIFAPNGKPVSEFIYKSFDVSTSSAVKFDGTSVKINEKGQEVK